jgi:outer membrane biosynthesis protein TonB
MKVRMVAFILLAVLLALVATPVYAQSAPVLPHAFYGTIEVNGSPAPVGTQVEVRGEGVQTGIGNNPIEVTVEGEYGGGADPLEPKLIVQGDIAEGTAVTFYVNGVSTGQTAEWHSGEVTEIDLAATVTGPPPETSGSSGTTPAPTPEPAPQPSPQPPSPETIEPTPPAPAPEVAPEEAPPAPLLPPPPPAESGNSPILWMVIGGVVVVGLIILFVVARLRAY